MAFVDFSGIKRAAISALAGAAAGFISYISGIVGAINTADVASDPVIATAFGSVVTLVVLYIGKVRNWFESM